MTTKWVKITDMGERPELGEVVLLHDGVDFFTGKMFANGQPPMWRYYAAYGETPTRDFTWWAHISNPEASNIGGGPIYHNKGTVIGAMQRP